MWLLRWLDPLPPVSLLAAAFGWGSLITLFVTGRALAELEDIVATLVPAMRDWQIALDGPVIEEVGKLLGVIMIALIAPYAFTRLLDGLTYGMMVGLGFAVIENIGFTLSAIASTDGGSGEAVSATLQTLFYRGVLISPWSHMVYTGVAGVGVAYYLTRTDRGRGHRLAVAIGLFAVAVAFHALNNVFVPLGEAVGGLAGIGIGLVAPILLGFVLLALLIVLYRRLRRDEHRWFTSVVGDEIGTPVVSASEAEALRTQRLRRQARHAARAAGGKPAAALVRRLQATQLEYAAVRSHAADPAAAAEAARLRERIGALRTALEARPHPAP